MQEYDGKSEKRNRIFLAVFAIFLVVVTMLTIFYIRSTRPRTQAKKEAIEIAKEQTQLETVDSFYWFTRKETYFTVAGKNNLGEKLFVIIPKTGEEITVLKQNDGMGEAQIRQMIITNYKENSIQKVNLGLYKKKPTWEVVTKNDAGFLNYYLLSFEKAEEIMIIKNI